MAQFDGKTESFVHIVNPGLGCHHMRSSQDVGAGDGSGVTISKTGEADGAGVAQMSKYSHL